MDMASDKAHLLLRGKTYFARVAIPPSVRPAFGSKITSLVRTLKTKSLSEAQRNKHKVVGELQDLIEAAKAKAAGQKGTLVPTALIEKADAYRKRIEQARRGGDDEGADNLRLDLAEASAHASMTFGDAAFRTMWDAGNGATPLRHHFETWMTEKRFSARAMGDHKLALRTLEDWLNGRKMPLTVDEVTNRVAGEFKIEEFSKKGVHPKTANKKLSSLRTYWKWLINHGHAETGNPWIGLSLPKRQALPDEMERPFTDQEVVRLFGGGPDRMMRDVMGIAALSGLRKEEIFQLTVANCKGGVFNIRRSKTNAGIRKVPIHPDLATTVQTRCAGKADNEFLIHEATAGGGWGEERSMPFSKRFQTYRISCGVDEVVPEHRRARVNFHSFRRWFITKADQQGHRREDIERTVGHKVQGMSLGLYSGGATEKQLQVVVESVVLPDGIRVDAEARPVRVIKPKVFLKKKANVKKTTARQKVKLTPKPKA
jgi:integrase